MRERVINQAVIDIQEQMNNRRLMQRWTPQEYARVCELLVPELKARWRVAKFAADGEASR